MPWVEKTHEAPNCHQHNSSHRSQQSNTAIFAYECGGWSMRSAWNALTGLFRSDGWCLSSIRLPFVDFTYFMSHIRYMFVNSTFAQLSYRTYSSRTAAQWLRVFHSILWVRTGNSYRCEANTHSHHRRTHFISTSLILSFGGIHFLFIQLLMRFVSFWNSFVYVYVQFGLCVLFLVWCLAFLDFWQQRKAAGQRLASGLIKFRLLPGRVEIYPHPTGNVRNSSLLEELILQQRLAASIQSHHCLPKHKTLYGRLNHLGETIL